MFSCFRVIFLRCNKRIHIGKGSRIESNTQIITNNGGTIVIGKECEIMHGVIIMTYGGKVKIGNRCSINPYTIIYGVGEGTIIGNDVLIAGHCMLIPFNHNFQDVSLPINQQGWKSKGVVIEDNVWIGAGSKILDGTTIRKGSIIAAGSVVNKDVQINEIVGGVPHKLIKKRI